MKIDETLEDRLVATGHRPSGFDYLRLCLAAGVICGHSLSIGYGPDVTLSVLSGPARPFLMLILPLFFGLSGFLIAFSLERCRTLLSFLSRRVLRCIPALAVETVLSALILGPIFTILPIWDYLRSPQFHHYFLNIICYVHFRLPGVFLDNPWPNVLNGQLWSLPYELYNYTLIAVCALVALTKNRRLFLALVIALQILMFVYYAIILHVPFGGRVEGPMLMECSLFGISLYQYRERILWDKSIFVICLALTIVLLNSHITENLAPFPATYVAVYLGLFNPRRVKPFLSGDYSYGLYLYGWPVQQMLVATWPILHIWYLDILTAVPTTAVLAVFSWHVVEKTALDLRSAVDRIEERYLQMRQARVVPAE